MLLKCCKPDDKLLGSLYRVPWAVAHLARELTLAAHAHGGKLLASVIVRVKKILEELGTIMEVDYPMPSDCRLLVVYKFLPQPNRAVII